MTKRRDALRAMMTPITAPQVAPEDRPLRSPAPSGSLKAMGLSLKNLAEDADDARTLRAQLASGSQVVELDPNLIDPSFVRDRLDEAGGEEFEMFKASLAENGQQVPILVRPRDHGTRYQAAYGHRRLAALRAIGRPVKAIVRDLTDEELVVAQGKENSDRRDLSFIERALFAARLEDHGFARSALVAALSLQKGNLSTMISIARSIPEELITAIGAAPKIGRPRWEHLVELLQDARQNWRGIVSEPGFETADSDVRFERLIKGLLPEKRKETSQVIKAQDGNDLARVRRGKDQLRLTIDIRQAPDFGAYLVELLPEIYATYRRRGDA
jgi:ParB family transcriptional regulator, chromosome partitioning protein